MLQLPMVTCMPCLNQSDLHRFSNVYWASNIFFAWQQSTHLLLLSAGKQGKQKNLSPDFSL